jgi:hypothetical protein
VSNRKNSDGTARRMTAAEVEAARFLAIAIDRLRILACARRSALAERRYALCLERVRIHYAVLRRRVRRLRKRKGGEL